MFQSQLHNYMYSCFSSVQHTFNVNEHSLCMFDKVHALSM